MTAGGTAEVFVYDGVGHAFMNESPSPFESFDARTQKLGFPAHDPNQAALAWGRLFGFLEANLRGRKDEL